MAAAWAGAWRRRLILFAEPVSQDVREHGANLGDLARSPVMTALPIAASVTWPAEIMEQGGPLLA